MEMENLKQCWYQLNLSIEKDNKIIVTEDQLTKEINRGRTSIIRRLYLDRVISKEIIRNSMMKIWKTTSPYSILDIQPNTFIFSFVSIEDMDWVMSRRPWLLRNLMLQPLLQKWISLRKFSGSICTIYRFIAWAKKWDVKLVKQSGSEEVQYRQEWFQLGVGFVCAYWGGFEEIDL